MVSLLSTFPLRQLYELQIAAAVAKTANHPEALLPQQQATHLGSELHHVAALEELACGCARMAMATTTR